jgi:hypothetical protein
MAEPVHKKATDLHEVIRRGNVPKKLQAVLFMKGNCLFLCKDCHTDASWAAHSTYPWVWQLELIVLVRTLDEIYGFIKEYNETFKLANHHIDHLYNLAYHKERREGNYAEEKGETTNIHSR